MMGLGERAQYPVIKHSIYTLDSIIHTERLGLLLGSNHKIITITSFTVCPLTTLITEQ